MISLNDLESFYFRVGPVMIEGSKARAVFGETPVEDRDCWLYTFTVQVERKIGNSTVGRFLPPSTRLKQLLEQAGVPTELVLDDDGDPHSLQGEVKGDPEPVIERLRQVISTCPTDELSFDPHPERWSL